MLVIAQSYHSCTSCLVVDFIWNFVIIICLYIHICSKHAMSFISITRQVIVPDFATLGAISIDPIASEEELEEASEWYADNVE